MKTNMKKILCTLIYAFMLVSRAYADGEPAHIVLDNVIELTGGNDSIYLQTNDYSVENRTTASSITVLDTVWSSRPVMFNSIPSGRNALMNPGEPVDVIVRGNKLSIVRWGGDGVYSIRLLDSNGAQILRDTLRAQRDSDIEVEVTPEFRHYYLEFTESEVNYDYDSDNGYVPSVRPSEKRIQFCYILLRMRGSNEETKPEIVTHEPAGKEPASASEIIDDIYRQLRKNTVRDNVIRIDESQNETISHDEVFVPLESSNNLEREAYETRNEEYEESSTMIPERRIRIKHSTEYENGSESADESNSNAESRPE